MFLWATVQNHPAKGFFLLGMTKPALTCTVSPHSSSRVFAVEQMKSGFLMKQMKKQ